MKSTIVLNEKYYRFTEKVLSFFMKSSDLFIGKYRPFV